MSDPVRQAALDILLHLDQSNQTLDACLEERVTETHLSSRRDRNFIYALVFGVLRHRGRLDWILSRCSDKSLKKLDTAVLGSLRLGLFQIQFMDRVPASAAVNTSVDLAKNTVGPWTGGFVNAILRRAIREADRISYPNPEKDPVGWMRSFHSLPQWLAKRWQRAHGARKAFLLAAESGQRAPLTLRTNTLKCSRNELITALEKEEFQVAPGTIASQSLHVEVSPKPVMETKPFEKGWFQVQDEAAQLVTELLAPRPGQAVLDACAGLGGKTGHIAQMMENQGTLVAMDRGPEKLARLREEMTRLGVQLVTCREQDIICVVDPGLHGQFDRVLLDAPCSGMGVIRRNPDMKWRMTPAVIAEQGLRQLNLLQKAASWVKPGGILVYSVCSTEPEETEQVISQFMNGYPTFELESTEKFLPQAAHRFVMPNGVLQTDPIESDLDGFYAARFCKKLESE